MKLVADVMWFRKDLVGPGLATFLLILMTYVAGRVHQFFKQTVEREQAFRDGYNQATRALFSLATRASRGVQGLPLNERRPAPVKPMVGYASVPDAERRPLPAKHRAEGRRKRSAADTEKLLAQTRRFDDAA